MARRAARPSRDVEPACRPIAVADGRQRVIPEN